MSLPPPPLPGDRVGGYTLGRALGVGGTAAVYEATGPRQERVAVKVLHAEQLGAEDVRRFKREILALCSLNHPGIVRVLDAGREGPYPWMAMEFVDGTDLGALVDRWRADPPPDRFARVEAILRGLCEALGTVHGRGIIHRDIKPSNVLITRDGQVKLTDFGVARSATGMTLPGEERPVGTLAFMAPEQIRGGRADPRSDLYGLGAVLYELLTGVQPFVATTVAGYMEQHLHAKPRAPSELDPRVPPRLEAICLRLLQKDPAQRYASAGQILRALERDEAAPSGEVRGREAELTALLARAHRLAPGRGGMVVVTGPRRCGRTTLLNELARRARAIGQDVACCSSADPDPIATLCEQLPDLGDALRPHADASARLVHRASGRPWVLLIDDLDRMEPAALDALTALARDRVAIEGEPLLLVATARERGGAAEPLVTGASTGLSPEVMALGALDEEAVASIAQDHGLMGMAAHHLGRRLVALGVHQPGEVLDRLVALERLGLLVQVERGGLVNARGVEALVEGAGATVEPMDLSALGPEALEVAQALAAMDGEADEGVLLDALGPSAAGGLEALARTGLITREPETEDQLARCRLSGAVTSGALLWATPPVRQRELHARLAAALRARVPRGGRWQPLMADQLQRAGQLGLAWPALVEAAHRALRIRQPEEAWRWLRRAVEIRGLGEPTLSGRDRLAVRVLLYGVEGTLWSQEQSWERAAEAWREEIRFATKAGDADAARRGRVGLAQAMLGTGIFEPAVGVIDEALASMSQGDPSWPRAVAMRSVLRLASGDASGASEGWRALAVFAAEVSSHTMVGNALAWQAEIASLQDQREETARLVHEGLGLEHLQLADRVRLHAAQIAVSEGGAGLDEAGRVAVDLLEEGLRRQDPTLGAPALAMCRALLDAGRPAEATRVLPPPDLLSLDLLDAPRSQRVALLARVSSAQDAQEGASLARHALGLPMPRLPWLAALTALDLAAALAAADPEEARPAAELARGLAPVSGLAALRRRQAAFP